MEPPAAVPLNNELAAAKGEAAAAEEAVMWRLTGLISDNLTDVQAALDAVSALRLRSNVVAEHTSPFWLLLLLQSRGG